MILNDRSQLGGDVWANRRVLVTGANGFVGNWLVRALIDRRAFVGAFVRSTAFDSGQFLLPEKGSEIIRGDVTDLKFVSEVINDLKIDTVYHLAASNVNTGIQVSPYDLYETNIRGVYTVLESARLSSRPVRVVVASSKEVEDCFLTANPRKYHPYMTSKAAAEMIVRAYSDTYGLSVAILRSDNLYGGGDFNWNRLIPGVIKSILQGQTPVIHGDGSARRDYLYIEDAIEAYLAVGSHLEQAGLKGALFRISTGSNTCVLDIVKEIMRVAGVSHLTPKVLGQKVESRIDIPYQPDFERATLGWQSHHSLTDGLMSAWEWYQNHFKISRRPEEAP